MLKPLLTIFLITSFIQAPSDFDRTLSLEQLIEKLYSENAQERAIARQLLPFKNPMMVLPKIIPALGSDNYDIRGCAKNILFDLTNQMAKAPGKEKEGFVNALLGYFADTSLKEETREYILKALSFIMDDTTNPEILEKYLLDGIWRERVRVALVENNNVFSAKILCRSLNQLSDEDKVPILLGLFQMKEVPCIDDVAEFLDSSYMPLKVATTRVLANTGSILYAPKLFELCLSMSETEPLYQELWDAYIRLAEKSALNGGNWNYTMAMFKNVVEHCKIQEIVEAGITGLGRFGDETVFPVLEGVILDSEKERFHISALQAIRMLNTPAITQSLVDLCSKLPREKQLYLIPALIQRNDEKGKEIVNRMLKESGINGKRVFLHTFYENPSLLYIDYIPTVIESLEETEKQKLVECLWRLVAMHKEVEKSEETQMGRAYLYLFKLCPPEEREMVMEGIKRFPTYETIDVLLPELGKQDPKDLPFQLLFELYNVIPAENGEKRQQIYSVLREQLATIPMERIIGQIGGSKNIQQFYSLAGFVEKWNLLGPFQWNKDEPFGENYGFPTSITIEATYKYKDKEYIWKKDASVEGWGYVGLMGLCSQAGMDCEDICAFAYTKIEVPEDTTAFACIGSDDGFRLWVNQEEVAKKHVDRGMRVDEDKVELHLKKGENDILMQITQLKGGWNFCFRLTDSSGKPLIFDIKPL